MKNQNMKEKLKVLWKIKSFMKNQKMKEKSKEEGKIKRRIEKPWENKNENLISIMSQNEICYKIKWK